MTTYQEEESRVDPQSEMSFNHQTSPGNGSGNSEVKKRKVSAALSKYERNSIVKTGDVDLDFSEIEIMIQKEMSKE